MRWKQRQLRVIDRLFAKLERKVALISRCQPRNAAAEQSRLVDGLRRGDPRLPRWTYGVVPELSEWRSLLDQALQSLSEAHPIELLYLERAEELRLETQLVEAVGTRQFRGLSTRRYVVGDDAEHSEAEALMHAWGSLPEPTARDGGPSDDESDPDSLYSAMRRAVGELKLPVRVQLSESLSAAAATGDGAILVARGRHLSPNDVRRIVLHEVLGHAAPRYRASLEPLGLFAVGSRAGNDEQEGYALFLERRAGVMDDARRLELARRHRAALEVRQGADWVETARALIAQGAPMEVAAAIASRVLRAGGLAREVVYLPALARVSRAVQSDPAVEGWLSRGRLSVEAVQVLRRAEVPVVVDGTV